MEKLPSAIPQEALTTRLMQSTEELTKTDLIVIEQKMNFRAVLTSDEPNFRTLVLRHPFGEVIKPVTAISFLFLRSNFSDQGNIEDVAVEFAGDVIQREPTWNIHDVIHFFKFIRMSQGADEVKFYGKVTSLRLLEMVSYYEGFKAEEREKLMGEKRQEGMKKSADVVSALLESGKLPKDLFEKNPMDNSVSIKMGKDFEKVQNRDDGKVPYSVPADENYFKQYTEPEETFEPNIEEKA